MSVACGFRAVVALALGCALSACSSTTDSLGGNPEQQAVETPPPDPTSTSTSPPSPPPPPKLIPLSGPDTYDSAFRDVIVKDPADIEARVDDAYEQLFHGDPDTEAIYFEIGNDEATIKDLYHGGDERTEGIGLGMLYSVELGRREEFDKLWTHAKRKLRLSNGANAGYYPSFCDTSSTTEAACVDPYGMEMFAMSLIFAHDVWDAKSIDYGADALELLDVMRHQEDRNGGLVDGVTNVFDAETHLVFDVPNVSAASRTRPSILMPAFYVLWSEATGDAFYQDAADAARDLLTSASSNSPAAGLFPQATYFDGKPVAGRDTFAAEAYRVFPNIVLDLMWTQGSAWESSSLDRVLTFFYGLGIEKYGTEFKLDGSVVDTNREEALIAVNGLVAARSSTIPLEERKAFIQAVWDQATPADSTKVERKTRYFKGLMQLFALLVLSGKMRVL